MTREESKKIYDELKLQHSKVALDSPEWYHMQVKIAEAANEYALWDQLLPGHEVTVTRKSRAKGSPEKGAVGIITGYKDGTYGRTYFLKDKQGNFYRSPGNALEVTAIKPDWTPPEELIPIIVIPRKNSIGWTKLHFLGPAGEQVVWPERLYINGVKVKGMKYSIITLNNGEEIIVIADQSFTAEIPTWAYSQLKPGLL
jgi:hypothetical protein